jgi:hypothetical protein
VNARKLSSLESLTADSSFPKDETDRRTIDFATWGDPANPSHQRRNRHTLSSRGGAVQEDTGKRGTRDIFRYSGLHSAISGSI